MPCVEDCTHAGGRETVNSGAVSSLNKSCKCHKFERKRRQGKEKRYMHVYGLTSLYAPAAVPGWLLCSASWLFARVPQQMWFLQKERNARTTAAERLLHTLNLAATVRQI